jgi:IS30 family transposase
LTQPVKDWISQLIEQDLSPQQAVDYLKSNKGISLHHETVYQYIYRDKANGGQLHQHLRIANKPYRKRYGKNDRRGQIKNRISIEQRPEIVEQKARIGDWEGDTVIGKGHKGALLTLVERKTLYTLIVPLQGKQSDKLAQAVIDVMSGIKSQVLTITYDNGKEFADHELMASRRVN